MMTFTYAQTWFVVTVILIFAVSLFILSKLQESPMSVPLWVGVVLIVFARFGALYLFRR